MRWLVKTWSSKIVSGSPTCITSSPAYADLGGFLRYSSVHSPKISAEFASKEPSDQNNRHEKKPRKQVCKLVLDSFDVQYSKELRHLWSTARDVLLKPQCWQYGVMLNRFSHLTDLEVRLRGLGFYSLLPYADSGLQTQSHPADTQHSLQCLVHKDPVCLPNQKHQPNLLKQYYLLNAASLLPVLALGVREGEKVLDLCSAPGGKALAILQSVTPGMLHCNEVDSHRFEWLRKTLESFVPPTLNDRIRVTNLDGRIIGHSAPGVYDKVLVDAPCSNDRSWLYTPHAQQGELWLRERALLPGLQKELLRSDSSACGWRGGVLHLYPLQRRKPGGRGRGSGLLSGCEACGTQQRVDWLLLRSLHVR
ncbi:tRNA (cytosine(34)-C(5))-methyltransferase, mitochondrial isoform X2 [Chanos chanos]|uniref:tRNA (Cytosine(34)-C(5))-methyltransferase, mitochondrial isoform X2 n=1 Tax=Chanos chanos TaxID=29144 RepID=A0A6J2VXE0_CHACN|nr:tRNA (cytosine(34)-C(5))-methyltransferase, mitochondrial isoform X2 [Chanos chanos]